MSSAVGRRWSVAQHISRKGLKLDSSLLERHLSLLAQVSPLGAFNSLQPCILPEQSQGQYKEYAGLLPKCHSSKAERQAYPLSYLRANLKLMGCLSSTPFFFASVAFFMTLSAVVKMPFITKRSETMTSLLTLRCLTERKSVGRRISEVFGMKGKREEGKAEEVEGHVKFEKFPEIID